MRPGDSGTDGAAALAAVLAPAFLRKLDRLHLTVRRSLSTRPGNTPMPRGAQGSGIELENYKSYNPGDDLRHLDWNAYGRLDQLLIKTFRAEREAPVHLFIDLSSSMAFPPSDGKLSFALSLAVSLAYITLRNADPVRVVGVSADLPRLHVASSFFRHRQALPRLRDFLLQLRAAGATALGDGVAAALREQRAPGVAIVLSDFLMDSVAYESTLVDLAARRFTVAAARIIGPAERNPALMFRRGQLVDAETGRRRFITLSADNLARHEQALANHLARLQGFCARCGLAFCVADTGVGLEHTLFHQMPDVGVVH
jgi:uncharacterized protein (DUF58 family)